MRRLVEECAVVHFWPSGAVWGDSERFLAFLAICLTSVSRVCESFGAQDDAFGAADAPESVPVAARHFSRP